MLDKEAHEVALKGSKMLPVHLFLKTLIPRGFESAGLLIATVLNMSFGDDRLLTWVSVPEDNIGEVVSTICTEAGVGFAILVVSTAKDRFPSSIAVVADT